MLKKLLLVLALFATKAHARERFNNSHGDNLYLLSKTLSNVAKVGEFLEIKPSDDENTRKWKSRIQKGIEVSLKIGLAVCAVEFTWLMRDWLYGVGAFFNIQACMTDEQIQKKLSQQLKAEQERAESDARFSIDMCILKNYKNGKNEQDALCGCQDIIMQYEILVGNEKANDYVQERSKAIALAFQRAAAYRAS